MSPTHVGNMARFVPKHKHCVPMFEEEQDAGDFAVLSYKCRCRTRHILVVGTVKVNILTSRPNSLFTTFCHFMSFQKFWDRLKHDKTAEQSGREPSIRVCLWESDKIWRIISPLLQFHHIKKKKQKKNMLTKNERCTIPESFSLIDQFSIIPVL